MTPSAFRLVALVSFSALIGIAVAARIIGVSSPAPGVAVSHVRTPPPLDVERLIRCFEAQESGGVLHALGDGGESWGLYQFQRPRWAECGGDPAQWGRAGREAQTSVMREAVRRYLRRCPSGATVDEQITYCARTHVGWGKSGKSVAISKRYAAKLLARYEEK